MKILNQRFSKKTRKKGMVKYMKILKRITALLLTAALAVTAFILPAGAVSMESLATEIGTFEVLPNYIDLARGTSHYYKINIPQYGKLNIDMRWGSGDSFGVFIYDTAGNILYEDYDKDVSIKLNKGKYYIEIRSNSGAWDNTLSYKFTTTFSPVYLDTTITATPGAGSVFLKWTVITGSTKYRVQRYDGKVWKTVGTPSAANFTDKNLTVGKKYSYRIMAYMNGEWSCVSKTVSATPIAAIPTSVTATVSDGAVTLKWKSIPGVTRYRVQRKNGSAFTTIGYTSACTYTNRGLRNGTTYYYRVLACANGQWGKPSAVVNAKPAVTTPARITAVPSGNRITVSWTSVPNATRYRIQYLNGNTWSTVAYSTTTRYTTNYLQRGRTYSYRVLAYANGKWGPASSVAKAAL